MRVWPTLETVFGPSRGTRGHGGGWVAKCQKGSWQLWSYNRVFGNICYVAITWHCPAGCLIYVCSCHCTLSLLLLFGQRGQVRGAWVSITGIWNEFLRGAYQFIQISNAKTFATIDAPVCRLPRCVLSDTHTYLANIPQNLIPQYQHTPTLPPICSNWKSSRKLLALAENWKRVQEN